MDKLIPPDRKRCQFEYLEGSFMTLGPRSMIRCKEKPTHIATENEPSPKDGKRGSMSLCDEHCSLLLEKHPGWATLRPIPKAKRKERARG